jgi:hypothetical protein
MKRNVKVIKYQSGEMKSNGKKSVKGGEMKCLKARAA